MLQLASAEGLKGQQAPERAQVGVVALLLPCYSDPPCTDTDASCTHAPAVGLTSRASSPCCRPVSEPTSLEGEVGGWRATGASLTCPVQSLARRHVAASSAGVHSADPRMALIPARSGKGSGD